MNGDETDEVMVKLPAGDLLLKTANHAASFDRRDGNSHGD
jgi:hypothetical protein